MNKIWTVHFWRLPFIWEQKRPPLLKNKQLLLDYSVHLFYRRSELPSILQGSLSSMRMRRSSWLKKGWTYPANCPWPRYTGKMHTHTYSVSGRKHPHRSLPVAHTCIHQHVNVDTRPSLAPFSPVPMCRCVWSPRQVWRKAFEEDPAENPQQALGSRKSQEEEGICWQFGGKVGASQHPRSDKKSTLLCHCWGSRLLKSFFFVYQVFIFK